MKHCKNSHKIRKNTATKKSQQTLFLFRATFNDLVWWSGQREQWISEDWVIVNLDYLLFHPESDYTCVSSICLWPIILPACLTTWDNLFLSLAWRFPYWDRKETTLSTSDLCTNRRLCLLALKLLSLHRCFSFFFSCKTVNIGGLKGQLNNCSKVFEFNLLHFLPFYDRRSQTWSSDKCSISTSQAKFPDFFDIKIQKIVIKLVREMTR